MRPGQAFVPFLLIVSAASGCNGGDVASDTGDQGSEAGAGNPGAGGTSATGAGGGSGTITMGKATSLAAEVVGAWDTASGSCSTTWDYAYFLCPGGRIRGAGRFDNVTEVACGSYAVSAAVYSNCSDRYGCFDKVSATVSSTLTEGGQKDVDPSFAFALYHTADDTLLMPAGCSNGSSGYLTLKRIGGQVSDDYCVSSACPAPSGSTDGGYGKCSADCDCGQCWFCEDGTCRWGGSGPEGCYRGCSG